jgi:tRNA threonylcarbamoyladenosine biosynthesis protein TsaB
MTGGPIPFNGKDSSLVSNWKQIPSFSLTPDRPKNAMLTLALETSAQSGSIAILRDRELLTERILPQQQRTAQSLAPGIVDVLRDAGLTAQQIDLIAVTQGPGSFTGLRVGITTAKIFGYATKAAVLGVNTLEVLAQQASENSLLICAVLDAQRQQQFSATYSRPDAGSPLAEVSACRIINDDVWLASLKAGMCVIGPGLAKRRDALLPHIPDGVVVADRDDWSPRANVVGQLAFDQYATGRRDDLWKLLPHYHRKSAAEEKIEQQPN